MTFLKYTLDFDVIDNFVTSVRIRRSAFNCQDLKSLMKALTRVLRLIFLIDSIFWY